MLKALSAAPRPVVLVILSFLCPTEFSLYLAGLRLPPHRVALILLVPFALYRMATSRNIRIRSFDILLLAFAAWTLFAYWSHSGWEGFVYGGSLALESFGGYIVARVFVRSPDDALNALRVMVLAIIVAALIALPETLFGQIFTHDALRALTGFVHPTGIEQRLKLTRAYGTFDHPIHLGTFCAALLALFWFAEKRASTRRRNVAISIGATFLGLSSAPMLCLAVQGALIGWERVTRGIKGRLLLTCLIVVALYAGVAMVSNRTPFAIIATGFTLDPWTGFYRLQIWENGLANVEKFPWTGIGLDDWERPSWMVSATVDAFWLVIGMRTGVPAVALLLGAILLLARAVTKGRARMPDKRMARLGTGWVISLAALSLVGCTVHYWNVLNTYFFFFLGLGSVWADPLRLKAPAAKLRQRAAASVPEAPAHHLPGTMPPPAWARDPLGPQPA